MNSLKTMEARKLSSLWQTFSSHLGYGVASKVLSTEASRLAVRGWEPGSRRTQNQDAIILGEAWGWTYRTPDINKGLLYHKAICMGMSTQTYAQTPHRSGVLQEAGGVGRVCAAGVKHFPAGTGPGVTSWCCPERTGRRPSEVPRE